MGVTGFSQLHVWIQPNVCGVMPYPTLIFQKKSKAKCVFAYHLSENKQQNLWLKLCNSIKTHVIQVNALAGEAATIKESFVFSVVLDQYLLQPAWTTLYLSQLKPILLAGLQQICDDKPEDPVQHLANFLMKASSGRSAQEQ